MNNLESKAAGLRVTGPLAPYAGGFESHLTEFGYAAKTRVTHLGVMSHLSRWLQAHQLGVEDLSREQVEQYLKWRRACGYTEFCSRRGLMPLLQTLGSLGLLPDEAPATRIDVLLGGFDRYLREEGLASCTTKLGSSNVAEMAGKL
jgi:hypothetical protein